MIVENNGEKFYIPDEIGNDKSKSVADIFDIAIPYKQYLLGKNKEKYEKELVRINKQIQQVSAEPDEIIVPNDEKFIMLNQLQNQKQELIELLKG